MVTLSSSDCAHRTEISQDSARSEPSAGSKFYIDFPPASVVEDDEFLSHLKDLVNSVYTKAEEGIFDDHYRRTDTEELRQLILARQLALASTSHTSPFHPATNVVGCIRIVRNSDSEGEWGTLVAAPESRGTGLGRQLVEFAEHHCRAWGASTMQIQLVVPITFKHPLKTWIQKWYEKMGYQVVRLEDFGACYPNLAPTLKTKVEYRIFEKVL